MFRSSAPSTFVFNSHQNSCVENQAYKEQAQAHQRSCYILRRIQNIQTLDQKSYHRCYQANCIDCCSYSMQFSKITAIYSYTHPPDNCTHCHTQIEPTSYTAHRVDDSKNGHKYEDEKIVIFQYEVRETQSQNRSVLFLLLWSKIGEYSAIRQLGESFIVKKFIVKDEDHNSASKNDQSRNQRRYYERRFFECKTNAYQNDPKCEKNKHYSCLETYQKYAFLKLIGSMIEFSIGLTTNLDLIVCCLGLKWLLFF